MLAILSLVLMSSGEVSARIVKKTQQTLITPSNTAQRLAQVQLRKTPQLNQRVTPTGPTYVPGKVTKPGSGNTGGGRHPGSGGGSRIPSTPGVSVNIPGLIGIITAPPAYTPPTYRKPKKVYRKPKKKKKKTYTARRTPRRPTALAVIQPIPQFIANEVTVLIDGTQPDGVDDALAQSLGLTKLSSVANSLLEGRIVTYTIPGNRQLPQVIAALTSDSRVSLAQPNNIYLTVGQKSPAARPSAQYSLTKLSVEPVHKTTQGRNVPVAVIDTGIDVSHPVLSRSVALSFDAVSNGPPKVQPHGTAIAGLIAGKGKVRGVAPLSSLLAVRAFYLHPVYKRPVTSSTILLRALDWSFANKARIFNLSFAGPYDPLVKAALTSASNKGVILVAAAGNGGPKAAPAYPAAYKNVIAITALDHKDKLYAHANRGNYLTVAAPGVDVLVPTLKRGYRYSSGTSLAAAHISGLIALLLERHPEASAEAILDAIRSSAHDLGPKGYDTQFGAGRADAHASLLSMTKGEVKLTSGQ
jgi:subtilisin family serine protease